MIRAMVVDDSLFMVKMISSVLERSGRIRVVGHAIDGEEAVRKARELRPDVITMDVVMPRMNGIEATRLIHQENPVPILILSAYTPEGARLTLQAMEAGAADCLEKPGGERSMDIMSIAEPLVTRLVELGSRGRIDSPNPEPLQRLGGTVNALPAIRPQSLKAPRVVVIGASAGGINAITQILPRLEPGIPYGILVVQHLPEGFTDAFVERLERGCRLRVVAARSGQVFSKGNVYVAPGGADMELTSQMTIRVLPRPDEPGLHPSVDRTLESVADAAGSSALAVILTGMGKDGARGVAALARRGGVILAQDEATSMVFGMPRAAIATGCVDKTLPLGSIAMELMNRSS